MELQTPNLWLNYTFSFYTKGLITVYKGWKARRKMTANINTYLTIIQ